MVISKRFVGKKFYFNCLMALIWLKFRRKITKIIILKKELFPHFAGITKQGNFIHFKTLGTHDFLKPFIFEGRFEVVSRSRWKHFIKNKKNLF